MASLFSCCVLLFAFISTINWSEFLCTAYGFSMWSVYNSCCCQTSTLVIWSLKADVITTIPCRHYKRIFIRERLTTSLTSRAARYMVYALDRCSSGRECWSSLAGRVFRLCRCFMCVVWNNTSYYYMSLTNTLFHWTKYAASIILSAVFESTEMKPNRITSFERKTIV